MNEHFDLIVLGSGNAGMAVAGQAREAGQSVLVVESGDVGGTCALRGCVPKKVLVAAAEALDVIRRAGTHHIEVGEAKLDWPALIARERTFVEGVPEQFEASLERRGITLARGEARFVAEDAVEVATKRYSGNRIVVATGSSPRKLILPGIERALTSDDVLAMGELPERVAFIGAGVVALELGHVLQRAGSEITLLEFAPRPLMRHDADQVAQLMRATEALGIAVVTDARVQSIGAEDGAFRVDYVRDDETFSVVVDAVVNGAGRVANLDLDLAAAGIAFDGRTLALSPGLRSLDNERIYFAGDAIPGRPQLSPVATYEGRIVGKNLVEGRDDAPSYDAIPSVVYTVPAVARVGLTEHEASERGLQFVAKVNDMVPWRSARTHAEEVAWAKVLIEAASGRILGAHLVGHGAAETIHAFASAIEHGWTAEDIKMRVYAYPTFHADLKHLV
jgi:glutathione reductase (NADPH)